MHPLEKELLSFIKSRKLLREDGENVVVAVSGGPDSICLLHLLARLMAHLNITLVVAHVNHGLRPQEADLEAELVENTARNLNVAVEKTEEDVKGYAVKHHLSVEHAGRILRYDFFDFVAAKHRAGKIALAHTADDQAEEILLRLLKGTGRAGLSGMKTRHRDKYIRPLLAIPKARLLQYLADIKAEFAEDSSNRQRIYLRNRIRLDLLPYLTEKFNPNISRNLRQTAEILSDEEELLAAITTRAGATILSQIGCWQQSSADDKCPALTVNLAEFLSQHRAVQRRLLEEACLRMRNTPYSRQIRQLLQLAARQGSGGGMLHLAHGLRVTKTATQLLFSYPAGVTAKRGDLSTKNRENCPIRLLIPGPGNYYVEELSLSIAIKIINKTEADYKSDNNSREYLDVDQLTFPLQLRIPEPGDRFHPLGSRGNKKVADFLCDQKVARAQRSRVAVLLSGDTIIALLGHRIAHAFRITSKTTRVARIQWAKVCVTESTATL
jgi:tRNA(Ile)-lysidine synthase